jgi:hypothetical protein
VNGLSRADALALARLEFIACQGEDDFGYAYLLAWASGLMP